jgi:DNA polymerase-3 subunit epsilon
MKVVFFDLETTGTLVNKHGIHQLSGEIIIDGEVKETFDFRVQPNPQALIEQEALDVAGVTKEQILAIPFDGNGVQTVRGYALQVCRSLQ